MKNDCCETILRSVEQRKNSREKKIKQSGLFIMRKAFVLQASKFVDFSTKPLDLIRNSCTFLFCPANFFSRSQNGFAAIVLHPGHHKTFEALYILICVSFVISRHVKLYKSIKQFRGFYKKPIFEKCAGIIAYLCNKFLEEKRIRESWDLNGMNFSLD